MASAHQPLSSDLVDELEEFTVHEKAELVAILTDPRNDTEIQAYRKYLNDPPKAASHLRSLLEGHGLYRNDERYKLIHILTPIAGSKGKPYWCMRFQNKTRQQLANELRPNGIIGLVSEVSCPLDAWAVDVDDMEDLIKSFDEVVLEERGKYIAIYGGSEILEQLQEAANWKNNQITGMEHEICERLVSKLQESGHVNVQTYSGPKQLQMPGDKEILGEIDAAALSDGCALIAKVQSTLSDETYYQLSHLLNVIRTLLKQGAPVVESFRSKDLLGVLAGRTITSNEISKSILVQQAAAHNIPIFLPNGQVYSVGNNCSKLSRGRSGTLGISGLHSSHEPSAHWPASRPKAFQSFSTHHLSSRRRLFSKILNKCLRQPAASAHRAAPICQHIVLL